MEWLVWTGGLNYRFCFYIYNVEWLVWIGGFKYSFSCMYKRGMAGTTGGLKYMFSCWYLMWSGRYGQVVLSTVLAVGV